MAEEKLTYTIEVSVSLRDSKYATLSHSSVSLPVGEVLSFAPSGVVVEAARAVAGQLVVAAGDETLRKLLAKAPEPVDDAAGLPI